MDLFHDNPMLQGVRQMLGAFAKQMMRPVADKHDREESMPWDLMKASQQFGMTQTSVLDGRKKLTGVDEDPDPKKPKSQARLAVVGSEELAYGCAGITLAIGGSGLAATPVARMGNDEQKDEFRRLLKGTDDKGHIKVAAMALSEPVAGSDSAIAATWMCPFASVPVSSFLNSAFCSSVPMRATGAHARPEPPSASAMPAQPHAISSDAATDRRACDFGLAGSVSSSWPVSFLRPSITAVCVMPNAWACFIRSHGIDSSRSCFAAIGRIACFANAPII